MKSEYTDDAYLNTCLKAMMGSDQLVQQWWDSPNLAFEGKTPRETYFLSLEDYRKVVNYILTHANGEYY